jgi:hypothetical protein
MADTAVQEMTMDPEMIITVAAIPVYGFVMVALGAATVALTKMTLQLFMSQQDLQTTETATPPSK